MELVLETRDQPNKSQVVPGIMMTPLIDENYWAYRVRLSDKQAVVGFPKFTTTGIGFAVEEADWNTNLPYTAGTEEIFQHIRKNKGDDAIPDEDVREAIRLIQAAAKKGANKQEPLHNHVTRDVKPVGVCPGCDDYHAREGRDGRQ
jgi:hypothetical protein